jgi:hypothetical protein
MSKTSDKPDVILDFRHENGINSYLIRDKRTREISWVTEGNLPKGYETSLELVRTRKGEFARQKVFGITGENSFTKKVVLAEENGGDLESGSSTSDSESSSDDGEGIKSALRRSAELDRSGKPQGLLGPRHGLPYADMLYFIGKSLRDASSRHAAIESLSPSEMNLDSLFNNLLGEKSVISRKHREILGITWSLILRDEKSEARDSALEQLCLLVSRLNDHDSIVSKSLDELLEETVIDEIDAGKFGVIHRLSHLLANSVEAFGAHPVISQHFVDEEMEDVGKSQARTRPNKYLDRFSYVPHGSVELDDAGITDLVYKIYNWKNPDKLSDVPGILEKYKTQLSVLFSTLMKKYAVEYSDLGDERVFVPIASKGQKLKDRLSEIFTTFEPSRLADVDQIVNRYIDKPTDEVADYIEELENSYSRVFGRITERSTSLATTSDSSLFGFRMLIEEALAIGNPERVPRIDVLLRKYSGKEHFLYLAVCDKYNIPVSEERFKTAMELREKSVEKARKARMRKVLTGVYEKYNKEKLGDITKLVDKFNVLELFDLVAKKYGIPLDEKVQLLLSTGVHTEVDVEFHPLIVQAVHGLALALELDRRTGFLRNKVPSNFLHLLTNITGKPMSSAELIIQAKSSLFIAHGPSGSIPGGSQVEALLRDLIENKTADVLRSLPVSSVNVQVTSQEPEYFAPDSFTAVETGRCSCVVSLKGPTEELRSVIDGIVSKMASSEVRQPTGAGAEPIQDDSGIVTGPGAFRCISIIRDQNTGTTSFVGDYRALQGPDACPSLYRARLSVWQTQPDSDIQSLLAPLLRDYKYLGKCAIVFSQTNHLVAVVGSHKHRTAFNRASQYVSKLLEGSEPSFSVLIPKRMCMNGKPGMVLPPQIHDWSDVSYHESADDLGEDDEDASEVIRPLKLTRETMRDSYLQGQLCLNCDETTHKPPECPIKRKVCWNCHGAHAGASCILPCRFCKGRHSWGILECVKRGAKRFLDWLKSRSCAEEKGLGSMVDDVIARLRVNGWNHNDPAVAASIKSLTQMGVFVDLYIDMAKLDESIGASSGRIGDESGALKPVPPSEPAPPLPDSQFAWMERVWLDEILSTELIGRDPLKLINTHKGAAIKKLEVDLNCKISFKGASAKDIFGGAVGADPSLDVRFHALILADTPKIALEVKKSLRGIISEIETGVAEGTIQKPPVVEGFVFLEKVDSLNDNVAQFDFMNANNGAPIEIDLKNHFEYIGDLRHWLHQKGVEVELGNDDSVKLPSSGKVIETLDAANRPNVDTQYIDIFNAFFELVSFWNNEGQYWFEPFELRPTGLLGLADSGAEHAVYESGQVVALSELGVDHFAKIMVQAGLVTSDISEDQIKQVIAGLKGVVRTSARDNRLLMYLKYPWALSSSTGTVARDVPESFDSVEAFRKTLNPAKLRECGRLGHSGKLGKFDIISADPEIIRKMLAPYNDDSAGNQFDVSSLVPGDGILGRLNLERAVPEDELPYMGYIVDWVTPQEVTDFVSGFSAFAMDIDEGVLPEIPVDSSELEPVAAVITPPVAVHVQPVGEDLNSLTVNELKERLKAKDLPTTGRKADLIERIKADDAAAVPEAGAAEVLKCRVELPRALMSWSELANNLTGPADSHFAHIKQMCSTVDIKCVGTPASALVGEARLHVQLTATNIEDFKKAKSLVEDLVKAVVEVGSEVCLPDATDAERQGIMKEVKVIDVARS